jgi:Tol biopolymer transport system component
MDTTARGHVRRPIRGIGSIALVLLAACAVTPPPGPPGPPGSTTSTTSTTSTSIPVPPGADGSIVRVIDGIGGEGGGESGAPSISGDGGRIAFWSTEARLVPGDLNSVGDIYVWDGAGAPIVRLTNAPSALEYGLPKISDDGQTVAYGSSDGRVFVWDATAGTTTRIPVGGSVSGISADGRRVLVLVDGGQTGATVWDATTGTTARVTDLLVTGASISGDGRYVAYDAESNASDVNDVADVYVWDAVTGTTTRLTAGDDRSERPDISDDGRYVAFSSSASSLVPGETSEPGVFVWDATTGAISRIASGHEPRMSADGRYVTFTSSASDLVPDDANGVADVFVWDGTAGTISRITDGDGPSAAPAISADGNTIAFSSRASNLTDDDPDGVQDVFLWRRGT